MTHVEVSSVGAGYHPSTLNQPHTESVCYVLNSDGPHDWIESHPAIE